jgi:hypothetical protein
VLAAAGLLVLATPAFARVLAWATAPPPPDLVVTAGQRGTTVVTAQIPDIPARLDLELVLDLSSSYRDDLPNIEALLPGLLRSLARTTDLRVGLSSFVDDPCCGGDAGDYVYRRHAVLSPHIDEVRTALAALRIGSGGDEPEAWLAALEQMLRTSVLRPNTAGVVLVATDASSHAAGDGSGSSAPSAAEMAARLARAHIRLVGVVPEGASIPDLAAIADRTGGSIQHGDSSSTDVQDVIRRGLSAVRVNVTPRLVAGCPVEAMTFDPSSASSEVSGSELRFTSGYQVSPAARPGDYECVVDLGEAGQDVLHVRVSGSA